MDLPIPSPNPKFYAKIKRQEAWSALPNHSIRVAPIGSAVVGQALRDSRVGFGPSRFYYRQPPLRLWASCTGPASRAAAGGWGAASRAAAGGWGVASRAAAGGWGAASRAAAGGWGVASRAAAGVGGGFESRRVSRSPRRRPPRQPPARAPGLVSLRPASHWAIRGASRSGATEWSVYWPGVGRHRGRLCLFDLHSGQVAGDGDGQYILTSLGI